MINELIQRYLLWLNAPYNPNPYFKSQEKQKEQIEIKIKELQKIKDKCHT